MPNNGNERTGRQASSTSQHEETRPMVCKMMKKGLIGVALGAGTLALLFGTSAPSYVRTAFHKVRATARASVPFEYDIDKARQDVAKLEPAIIQGIEALAKAEVDVEHLQKEITLTQADLVDQGKQIVALRQTLRTGDTQLTGGIPHPPAVLKRDLARRLDHYTQVERILLEKQETLKIRQQNVVAARESLDTMRSAKRELMTRIEGIETKLAQIKATRTANTVEFDDSAIGRARQTVAELETRLEEMAKIDELKTRYAERGVTVTVEPSRDVIKEVDAKFGTGGAKTDHTADRSF